MLVILIVIFVQGFIGNGIEIIIDVRNIVLIVVILILYLENIFKLQLLILLHMLNIDIVKHVMLTVCGVKMNQTFVINVKQIQL